MHSYWLPLLSYLVLLSCAATAEQFYVIPSSSTSCPKDPCYTLTDVVLNPSQYFASNTVIIFLPGLHQTNITKELSVLIKDVRNISMIGCHHTDNSSKSVIQCTGSLGFAFINVTEVKIAKLKFSFCGTYFPLKLTVKEKFVCSDDFRAKIPLRNMSNVTFYFLQTINVTISEVTISNSTGAGLVGINMLGLSNISHTIFSGNRPNCLLLFLNIHSTSEVISSNIFSIINSQAMFGKLPNGLRHSYWGATGFGIMLAQTTYKVHIYIQNIRTYNNNKYILCKWYGNLYFIIENWECHYSVIQAKQIVSTNIEADWDKTRVYLQPKTSYV